MNSDTSLRVRFGAATREVVLERGEAAFDVRPDASRPFTVLAGERLIRVLGTEFNVLYTADRTAIAVRHGLVQVRNGPEGIASDLRVGEELTYVGNRSTRRDDAADRAFAWQDGRLIYEEVTLAALAADINRYYEAPVRVDAAAAGLRFSGVLVLDGQESIVRRIEQFLPVDAVRAPDGLVLRLRPQASSR
jgi:transmembrane sensor